MKILSSISARWLIHAGAVEMTFTILLCYILAVSYGHVKPWLPTISACGENPPEQYFFRFGIFLGAIFLEVEAIALYVAKKTSHLTFILGAVAAIGLGVVAVVASNENNTVHTTGAVIFFVFEDIMTVLLTVDFIGTISTCSMFTKISSSTVACASTVVRLLLMMDYLAVGDSFPLLPVVEWLNTAAIVVFQLSFSADIHDLFVSVTQSDTPSPTVQSSTGTGTLKSPLVCDANDLQTEVKCAPPLPTKSEVILTIVGR